MEGPYLLDGTIKELIYYGERSELCKLTKQIVATHDELPSWLLVP
jgi:hypothetical protein